MIDGLFFLVGLGALVWLAIWAAQEGRSADKRPWSPFDWRDETAAAPVDPAETASAQVQGWRHRRASRGR